MRTSSRLFFLICAVGCERKETPQVAPSEAGPPSAVSAAVAPSASTKRALAKRPHFHDAGVAQVDAGTTLPLIEKIAVKKCPAKIAAIKLDKEHGYEGHVELTGCPDSEGGPMSYPDGGTFKALLTLFDAQGKKHDEVTVLDAESHEDAVELHDLYGTGHPVFFVTTQEPTMGSWGGPTTTLYEIAGDKLVPIQIAAKDGGVEPISLVSAIKVTWWVSPARSKKGEDIYEIRTSMDNISMGYRYTFEKGRWNVHSGLLKKWTGEHLSDTEAEFR